MPTRLYKAPQFTTVRSKSGAFAADSGTLSDANYPLTEAIEPFGGAPELTAYWYASGGTVHAEDYVDLQILYRDAKNPASARWVEGPIVSGVKQNQAVAFPARACTMCYVRVAGFVCASGTGLKVMAASAF